MSGAAGGGRERGARPVGFAFAVHLHQPVGNFDRVFREHLEEVYRPFLEALENHGVHPFSLHVSGPLLDWLESHDAAFVDAIGRGVADDRIELLGSGRTEPILAALGREDRVAQVAGMRERLRRRFGAAAPGLWLTERVWEADLAADLARAGVEYTLLDDRHFLAAGLPRRALDRPFRTESDGLGLTVLPIDERLRYLIPFQPVPRIEAYFRERRAEGAGVVVLGDDGEKFGGWPDTRAWVHERGWLDRFLTALERLRSAGAIELMTSGEAARRESGGLVYPRAGSYREMEAWALPRPAALVFEGLEAGRDGAERDRTGAAAAETASPDGVASRDPDAPWSGAGAAPDPRSFLRGGHWKGFLRKYPEANRMHKMALWLSRRCREAGDPPEARASIERAQCNDAYWHGVFGGVYLPHLRRAVWGELARAEAALRRGAPLACETLDWDFDGTDELWIHGSAFSAVVSPRRGGAIEVLQRFGPARNEADVLARRLEAYHGEPGGAAPRAGNAAEPGAGERAAASARREGIASVHDREQGRPAPPEVDRRPRGLFQELALDAERRVIHAWADEPFEAVTGPSIDDRGRLVVELASAGDGPRLRKTYAFAADGGLEVTLRWDRAGGAASVVTELSRARVADGPGERAAFDARLSTSPEAGREGEPIMTLARSERGFEWIDQGVAERLSWPAAGGRAVVRLAPP